MRARFLDAVAQTFRSLHVRNFRLFFVGLLVSQTGTWMQSFAQGWLVLRLGGGGFAIGVTLALQRLPSVVAGAWAGAVSDRVAKHRVVTVTQSLAGALALAMGALTLAGAARLWIVYLFALLLGCVNLFDVPARMSLVSEMVADDHLPNATALSSAAMHSARIFGPALAGILITTLGLGWGFVVNGLTYLAFLAALRGIDEDELRAPELVPRAPGQVRAGLRLVWSTPELRWAAVAVAGVSTFALNSQVLLPLMAKLDFGRDVGAAAVLATAMGAGAVAGALVMAWHGRATPKLTAAAGAALGAALVVVSFSSSLAWAVATLPLAGAFSVSFLAMAHALMQQVSPPAFRGRVLAIYATLAFAGALVGGPAAGALAEHVGARAAMGIGGAVSAAVVGVAYAARFRGSRAAAVPRQEPATDPAFAS